MAYYNYKVIRDRIPQHIIDSMGEDYEGTCDYDGDLWLAADAYIDELENKLKAQYDALNNDAADARRHRHLIAAIRNEIDRAVLNDHRLVPSFGKRQGELAVRVEPIKSDGFYKLNYPMDDTIIDGYILRDPQRIMWDSYSQKWTDV